MAFPVVVTCFRFGQDRSSLLAGLDAVAHGLLRHLARDARLDVTVLTVAGTDSVPEARVHGARVVALEVPASRSHRASELHALDLPSQAAVARDYGAAVARWLATEGPRPNGTRSAPVLLSNDLAEASYVPAARALGYYVVTLVHYLMSDLLVSTMTAADVERLARDLGVPRPQRAFLSRLVGGGLSYPGLMRLESAFRQTGLVRLFPANLRAPFENERTALSLSDDVVVPSGPLREKVVRHFRPAEPHRVRLVPWAPDLDAPPADPAALDALRDRYGVRDGDRVLLTMSRLSREKGLHLLLEGLALLERRHPELARGLHVVLCGDDGLALDRGFPATLRDLAARLQVVRPHLPGHVTGEARTLHYELADLVVVPSLYEAFGLTLVEAMSRGRPVLAAATDGARHLVTKETGTLFSWPAHPARRPGALAAALASALRSDLPTVGRSALARSAGYDWETTVHAILERTPLPRLELAAA